MVETFEALGTLCGMPLTGPSGLRLFGGHSLRVLGAQTLAAAGIEVAKLRILARHSGEAILRYVSDAPLRALRADLGLTVGTTDTRAGRTIPHATLAKLDDALARLEHQEQILSALQVAVNAPTAIV